MKILTIIRVYPTDDYIANLCYQSFLKVFPEATYIFFAEEGQYKHIPQDLIKTRGYCCNFGGLNNVVPCIEGLKKIKTDGYDKIIFVDADITLHKSPFDSDFDFGGIMHAGNDRHYSGQFMIFSKWVFDEMLKADFAGVFAMFLNEQKSISDDTIFSWVCTELTQNTRDFHNKSYWTHEKLHHLEP